MRGAVLAGGGATRFGGRPKGLEQVGGARILDRMVDTFLAALGELHPYQVPEILALPAERVSAPYACWVRAETTPE